MIPRKDIQRIKIAQKDAGLDDTAYRQVLGREAGVNSCKDLEPYQVPGVLAAIKKHAIQRDGWKARQIDKFRQYAKFAGMSLTEGRIFLSKVLNVAIQEEDPSLNQQHFDLVMAELETELELRISQGQASPVPEYIKLTYWRNRKPRAGESNTRETHKVWEVWYELQKWLDEDHRNEAYLLGIASQCCRKRITDIGHMSARESWFVIEALKGRLHQEQERMAREVPF